MSKETDETLKLVRAAKSGDQRAFERILRELDPELKKIAKRYFISGGDPQDVLQEARIGVWKAVQDFDDSKDMTFKNFTLNLCVKRNVITAVAAANRKKFDHHNNSASLDSPVWLGDEDSEQSLADFITDTTPPLLETMLEKETFEENARRLLSRLTQLEKAIFLEYSYEESYKDIADALGIKAKAVDNALMRIRKKALEVWTQYQDKELEQLLNRAKSALVETP